MKPANLNSGRAGTTSNYHRRCAEASWFRLLTALIPFLEHDDANRALMGAEHAASGQYLCLRPEAPLVGTGVERYLLPDDSGATGQALQV